MLEAVVAAVVGVGHVEVGRARGRRVELAQQVQPRRAPRRRDRRAGRAGCAGRRRGSGRSRRSRARATCARRALERDPARARRRGRARVGRRADVPVAGAGAVDLDDVLEPLLAQQRRASRPRRSASGRCCPCRRTGAGPRAQGWRNRGEPPPSMNPFDALLVPPALIKRALDDLHDIAELAPPATPRIEDAHRRSDGRARDRGRASSRDARRRSRRCSRDDRRARRGHRRRSRSWPPIEPPRADPARDRAARAEHGSPSRDSVDELEPMIADLDAKIRRSTRSSTSCRSRSSRSATSPRRSPATAGAASSAAPRSSPGPSRRRRTSSRARSCRRARRGR